MQQLRLAELFTEQAGSQRKTRHEKTLSKMQ